MLFNAIQEKREQILKVASKNGIFNLRIICSEAGYENVPACDLNFLVNLEEGRSLFDLIRFKNEIEELFHINVDVVTENSLHWSIKEDVLNKAIQL